jgi:hypothetical protein
VRLLMRCATCRLERVVNPDLARLRERSRRTRLLSTSVGAVFGVHQISPFILVGRLAQLKKSEPDFVCTRCQGTDADRRPITFCSRCGERLDESVLRTCPKCRLDLRTLARATATWAAIEPTDQPPTVAPPAPPGAPAVPVPTVSVPAGSAPAEQVLPNDLVADAPVPPGGRGVTPGWYPDPAGEADRRYWDGATWTPHVANRS